MTITIKKIYIYDYHIVNVDLWKIYLIKSHALIFKPEFRKIWLQISHLTIKRRKYKCSRMNVQFSNVNNSTSKSKTVAKIS